MQLAYAVVQGNRDKVDPALTLLLTFSLNS
jgi:hypothetical protein